MDYGSRFSHQIVECLRELQVHCELQKWNSPAENVMEIQPQGFILSGSPESAYAPGSPHLPEYVLASNLPILGICFGMQLLAHQLGGKVQKAEKPEYGLVHITITAQNPLLTSKDDEVWMSHADRVSVLPPGFYTFATTENCPIAAFADTQRRIYGLQLHPEVPQTPHGKDILERFTQNICQIIPK